MPSSIRRLPPDALLIALAFVLVAVYAAAGAGGFPLDDSWIHQTYARNLAQTGLWSFVPGVPSAGSTSPLYTLLLAAGYLAGLPTMLWTHALGAAALAGTAVLARRMALQAAPKVRGIGLAAGLAMVWSWHLLWAAASGMETALFSFLSMALLALAWNEAQAQPGGRRLAQALLFGAVSGLAWLTRPESLLLVGMIGVLLLAVRPGRSLVAVMLWGLVAAAMALTVVMPYLLFNLQQTGGLLPDTAAAKQAYAAPIRAIGVLWGLRLMSEPLSAGAQLLLVPGMIAWGVVVLRQSWQDRCRGFYLLPLLWGAGLVLLYSWWLPLPFQHGRYVIPALPALLLAGVLGTAQLLRWSRRSLAARLLARALALSAAVLFVLFALVMGLAAYRQDVRVIEEEMVAPARWIRDNLDPAELLAVHDIGAVGYFAPRPILDIAGLVSPEFIPAVRQPALMWQLMEEGGAQFLMALPDQVPGGDPSDSRLCQVFQSEGLSTFQAGGEKMTIYRLAWDGRCPAGSEIPTP
jgi:hypothetical protein